MIVSAESSDTLLDVLQRIFARKGRIVSLGRRPCAYRSSFAVEELDLRLDDGSSVSLLFKDSGRGAMSEEARRAKPEFLLDPRREIAAYATLLDASRLGTAACFGAVDEPEADRYWLFLERVNGTRLEQVGEFDRWLEVTRRLAMLHHRLGESDVGAVPLLRYDAEYFRVWPRRALLNLEASSSSRGEVGRLMRWFDLGYEAVIDRLCEGPRSIIHGDFHASNILVEETGDPPRVCPIDWEMVGEGPCLLDLAALTSGKWSDEAREALAASYHAARQGSGGSRVPDLEESREALDASRLHLCVQWLGWSSRWSPPPSQAHDWLGEATRLARALGA